jgi:galactokinase
VSATTTTTPPAAAPQLGIVDRLVGAGMSAAAAEAKARLFGEAAAALGADATVAWFVPGRIEFLGKHTDYAGGRSLLCAVEQGFCMVARPRGDSMVNVTVAATGEQATFPLTSTLTPRLGHWSNYPMTVAARVAGNFPGGLRGADLAFASDLPPAAGMSSSSALICGTFLALSDLNGLPTRDTYAAAIANQDDLCGYLGTIENGQTFGTLVGSRGVGTFGGSEDHTAILRSTAGRLVGYAFNPVRREGTVALPAGHAFVVASSGVVAEKTRAALEKYNRVSRTASIILDEWRLAGGDGRATCLAQALASAPDAADRLRAALAASRVDAFPPAALLARL